MKLTKVLIISISAIILLSSISESESRRRRTKLTEKEANENYCSQAKRNVSIKGGKITTYVEKIKSSELPAGYDNFEHITFTAVCEGTHELGSYQHKAEIQFKSNEHIIYESDSKKPNCHNPQVECEFF